MNEDMDNQVAESAATEVVTNEQQAENEKEIDDSSKTQTDDEKSDTTIESSGTPTSQDVEADTQKALDNAQADLIAAANAYKTNSNQQSLAEKEVTPAEPPKQAEPAKQ